MWSSSATWMSSCVRIKVGGRETTLQIQIPSKEKELNSCWNIAKKSPAKPCSVTERQLKHFLVNLSDLIPYFLFLSPRILAWFPGLLLPLTVLGYENPPTGRQLQKRGGLKTEAAPWKITTSEQEERWAAGPAQHLTLALGKPSPPVWPAAGAVRSSWLLSTHAPSSHSLGQCEGHTSPFWISSVFRLLKSKLTGDTTFVN